MINTFKHLLPTGRAWTLTVEKTLRKFFDALAPETEKPREFADDIFLDIFPATTRNLSAWENQFGLFNNKLSEAQRRTRLEVAWRDVGGQSPAYIQAQLQANGFNVFIHEWWVPGTEPAVGVHGTPTVRNPLSVLNPRYLLVVLGVDCGEELAACGEELAACGEELAGSVGYPLVNKFVYDSDIIGYTVPSDPTKWPFFMYVGGPNFGDIAEVPAIRRFEFEALLLKIRPAHLWIGVIVRYV